jgi:hypothetical protein
VGRGGDVAVVGESLVGIVEEEDIFGLQIGMDEVEVVKDCKEKERMSALEPWSQRHHQTKVLAYRLH